MKVEGRCHCGKIEYEAEVDRTKVQICHCLDCQTLTGSAYRVTIPASPDGFASGMASRASTTKPQTPAPAEAMRFVAIVAVLSFDYRQTTIRIIPFAWVNSISARPSVLHAGKFGFDGDCLGQKTSASSLRLIKELARGIYGSGHSNLVRCITTRPHLRWRGVLQQRLRWA